MSIDVPPKLRSVDLPYTIRIHGVTEEMFDELVDEDMKAELFDGVMIVHSPATLEHDDVTAFVRTLMDLYSEEEGLGKVFGPDSLVHLATCRKFGPDGYFVPKNRVPERGEKEFEGAPALVLETLSPSNRDYDLRDKREAYREAGVKEIWFVDPKNEQILIDRKRGKRYREEVVATGRAASDVLEGFWIDVAWLWADPRPKKTTCLRDPGRVKAPRREPNTGLRARDAVQCALVPVGTSGGQSGTTPLSLATSSQRYSSPPSRAVPNATRSRRYVTSAVREEQPAQPDGVCDHATGDEAGEPDGNPVALRRPAAERDRECLSHVRLPPDRPARGKAPIR